MFSSTTSNFLSAIPWRYLLYKSSVSNNKLHGSNNNEEKYRDSKDAVVGYSESLSM